MRNEQQQQLILRSVIRSSILEQHLLQGSCIAFVGVAVLFFTYYDLLPIIDGWASIFMWIGFGLIAIGLIPYKKLTRLEVNPYLVYVDSQELSLIFRQKCLMKLPLHLIRDVSHFETNKLFGMAISFENKDIYSVPVPRVIEKATKKAMALQSQPSCPNHKTIVIPYLTETSTREFSSHLHGVREKTVWVSGHMTGVSPA